MTSELQNTKRIVVKLTKSMIYNRAMMLYTHNVLEGSKIRQKYLKKFIKQDAESYQRDLDVVPTLKKGKHEYCFCYNFSKYILKAYLNAKNKNSFKVMYISEFHNELLDPYTYRAILGSYADKIIKSIGYEYIEHLQTEESTKDTLRVFSLTLYK